MEKLFNNGRDYHVTIYAKKYNRIYMPKVVYNAMLDAKRSSFTAVDVYVDEKTIMIVPNNTGEFTLCHNGTSPNGRNVTLNKRAIEVYGIQEGHYRCNVDKGGTLKISLSERV